LEKKNHGCLFGDCPGLDGGPKSREHETRFLQRGGASVSAGTMSTSHSDTSKNSAREQETAK